MLSRGCGSSADGASEREKRFLTRTMNIPPRRDGRGGGGALWVAAGGIEARRGRRGALPAGRGGWRGGSRGGFGGALPWEGVTSWLLVVRRVAASGPGVAKFGDSGRFYQEIRRFWTILRGLTGGALGSFENRRISPIFEAFSSCFLRAPKRSEKRLKSSRIAENRQIWPAPVIGRVALRPGSAGPFARCSV